MESVEAGTKIICSRMDAGNATKRGRSRMTPVKFSLFSTGYSTNLERFIRSDGSYFKTCRVPSTFAYIQHPQKGSILYDSGYSSRIFDLPKSLPFSLDRLIYPIFVEKSAKEIIPNGIDTIIISHFHPDHICGIKDFPRAEFLYLNEAWEHVKNLKGLKALKEGFIPELIPSDFEKRSKPFTLADCTYPTDLFPFSTGIDLLGDGSLIGIPLPGHAKGQMGLYLHSEEHGPLFLIADACLEIRQIANQDSGHWILSFLDHDSMASKVTLYQLHQLAINAPHLLMIPNHCQHTFEKVSSAT